MSSLAGVQAAHQVLGLTAELTRRALTSPIRTMMPPARGAWAREGSQSALCQSGLTWKMERLKAAGNGGMDGPVDTGLLADTVAHRSEVPKFSRCFFLCSL